MCLVDRLTESIVKKKNYSIIFELTNGIDSLFEFY